jgi:ADP-ribosylglycohydrolase
MKYSYKLYGAILGDLCGQPYERSDIVPNLKDINIYNPDSHITDDTIMTLASALCLLEGISPEAAYRRVGLKYLDCGFGSRFKDWLLNGTSGDSYGNGCLMRVSPFIWAEAGLSKIIESVICSHNHDDSYDAVLRLVAMYNKRTRRGDSYPPEKFDKLYADSATTIDFVNKFIRCYTSSSYLISKRVAVVVSYGGDTDTNASIIGELTNYHSRNITKQEAEYVESKLDNYLLGILKEFNNKF